MSTQSHRAATNGKGAPRHAPPPPAATAKPAAQANAAPEVQVAPLEVEGPLAKFDAPRLPWHPAIEERFGDMGVNRASWKVLVEAIWPKAKSVNAVIMALSYCRARQLDPFKRVVHIVPVWDSSLVSEDNKRRGGWVETIWPGIAELRATAFRTGQYAGCDETEWGPSITRTFKGVVGYGNDRRTVEKTVTFPEWGRITVYRMLQGQRVKFVGPQVHWHEEYATLENTELPNNMWTERPFDQFEKVVEAFALRKAFPEEIGNELTAEEMTGRRLLNIESTRGETSLHSGPAALVPPPPPGIVSPAPHNAAPAAVGVSPPEQAEKQTAPAMSQDGPKTVESQGQSAVTEAAGKPATKEPADSGFDDAFVQKLEKRIAEITTETPLQVAKDVLTGELDALAVVKDMLTVAGHQRALGIIYAKQAEIGGGRKEKV